MKTIWKYPLMFNADRSRIMVPKKAFPLTLRHDHMGELNLWMAVDPEHEQVPAEIVIVGTGHELPADAGAFVDTIFVGRFVFHAFYKEVE